MGVQVPGLGGTSPVLVDSMVGAISVRPHDCEMVVTRDVTAKVVISSWANGFWSMAKSSGCLTGECESILALSDR